MNITIIPAENNQKNLLDHYCNLLLSKPSNPYTCKSGFTKHTVLLAFFLHQTRQNCSFPSSSSSPTGFFFYRTPWRDKSCTLAEAFTNPNWRLKLKKNTEKKRRKTSAKLEEESSPIFVARWWWWWWWYPWFCCGIVKTNQKQEEKQKRNDKW